MLGADCLPVVRCADVNAWCRAVREASDLSLRRSDGRLEVSSRLVKAGLLYLATFADGPDRADPGGSIRPGLSKVRAQLEVSRSTALAIYRAGLEHGYLVRTARGHTGSTATYALALPKRVRTAGPSPETGSGPPNDRVRPPGRQGPAPRTPTYSRPTHDPLARAGASPDAAGDGPHARGGDSHDPRSHARPADDGGWSRVVDRLPRPIRRRLDDEPASDRQVLDQALAAAAASGAPAPRPDVLWDRPTALDANGVRSVSKTLASRIRGHLADAGAAKTA